MAEAIAPRLRVAMVAPSLGILGGQAVQADRLLNAWRGDPEIDAWLVPINPAPPPPLRWATRVKYLRTAVTESIYLPRLFAGLARADVVHVFSASYCSFLLAPLPAITAATLLGKPVILNYRSGEAPDHLRRSAIARATLRRVARNIVPSRFLVDVFERFGISATVIPNIVDADRFRFRERASIAPRVLSTRNFEDLYNLPCTLRAFGLVQQARPDATLTLVGAGRNEAALRQMAAHMGLRAVTFAGPVDPEAIPEMYARHDIYLQTPDLDNMPASVLEAFSCGLPVVSTKAGGVPAIVNDGENGLLAPLDDDVAIADHVLRLIESPQLAHRLTQNARRACEAYRWDAVRQQWLRAYKEVARGPFATRNVAVAERA